MKCRFSNRKLYYKTEDFLENPPVFDDFGVIFAHAHTLTSPRERNIREEILQNTIGVDCNVNEVDCNAIEVDCNAIEVDCNAIGVDCNAIEVDCNAIEVDCNANEVDCNVIEVDCNANEVDCNAIEVDCNAIVENKFLLIKRIYIHNFKHFKLNFYGNKS
jgi:hypothetical protein